MEFKFLKEVVEGIAVDLNVLSRGSEPYSMLLYQHEGILATSNHKIGNHQDVSGKLRSCFALLKQTGADLGLVPEYCCPFSSLSEVLEDTQKWPDQGKLWAIGMESIKKDELVAFTGALGDGIAPHFDQRVLAGTKNFLDPLIYLFRAQVHGADRLVMLIQFKNFHMGVWAGGDIERDNMISGREIYVLHNNQNSVHLISVICSEAMNLSAEMSAAVRNTLRWGDTPYLVLNPQVNPGPTHPCFLGFRNFVLGAKRTEIIGLNWNNLSKIGNTPLLESKSTRSGIYTRTGDVNFKNLARVRENHNRGLYYFYYGVDRHAFVFNSQAHAFLLQNTSVDINVGVGPQQMRNGPHLLSTFVFEGGDALQQVERVSDNHINYLQSVHCGNTFLISSENCIIEKELLACISTGEILAKSTRNWSELNNIWSVKSLENTEINRRITVGEDMDIDSTRIRDNYAALIEVLGTEILTNPDFIPGSLSDLKTASLLVGYSPQLDEEQQRLAGLQYFRFNLITAEGEMVWATVCYVGMASDEKIGRVYSTLQGLFDHGSKHRDRIVVFYKRKGTYHAKASESSNSIKELTSGNENSFMK